MIQGKEILYRAVAAVFERRWLVMFVLFAGLFATVFGTYLITPTWIATTKILVHQNARQQVVLFEDLQFRSEAPRDVVPANNLIEISRSDELAEMVVRQLDLDEELRRKYEEPEELRQRWINFAMSTLRLPITTLKKALGVEPRPVDYLAKAVDRFVHQTIDVQLVSDTEIVRLQATGESPRQANEIANTLALLLVEKTRDLDRNQARVAHDFTAAALAEAEDKLRRAETRLVRYKQQREVVDPDHEQRLRLARLDTLEATQTSQRVLRDHLATQIDAIYRQRLQQSPSMISPTEHSTNPVVTELRTHLNTLELEYARLSIDLTDEHPDMASLRGQIQETRAKLAGEDELVLSTEMQTMNPFYSELMARELTLRPQLAGTETELVSLDMEIAELRTQIVELSEKSLGYTEAFRQYQAALNLFDSLTSKLSELTVQQVSSMSEFEIKVFDHANLSMSARPDRPGWLPNLVVGFVLSLSLSVGLALALDVWKRPVKTAREIETALGIPVLATVPASHAGRARRASG